MNWVELAVLSKSEPLQWEKIGKVANQVKLAVPSQSELLWLEKIGKVANLVKLDILSNMSCFSGKDWKSCDSGELGHSESI